MEIPFKISHDLAGLSQPFSLLIIQNLLILIEKNERHSIHSFACSWIDLTHRMTSPVETQSEARVRGQKLNKDWDW